MKKQPQNQQLKQEQHQQDQDSAWYYKKREFKELIETIIDKSVTIEIALKGFRELPCLSKHFREKRLEEVADISSTN